MLCLRRDHLPPSLLSKKREREKGEWKEKRKQEGGNKEKDQRREKERSQFEKVFSLSQNVEKFRCNFVEDDYR